MTGTLFIISAPSGAGKTTLVERILATTHPAISLERVITYTTKAPREGEREGVEYHFISRERFDQLLKEGFFMEYSKAYTDYYGSPSSIIEGLAYGTSYLLIVDRIGAQEIVKKVPEAVLIWIEVPSIKELRMRLKKRGDQEGVIECRLRRAQEEIRLEQEFPLYAYHILNTSTPEAEQELRGIIEQKIREKGTIFDHTGSEGENDETSLLEVP